MSRLLCRWLGVAFVLAGLAGFVNPTLLGMHLTPIHNVIHILSGAIAIYLGFLGSGEAVKGFSLAFGAVYLLLGLLGFATPSLVAKLIGHADYASAAALRPDNIVHLALGGLFLFAAVADVTARVNPRPHLP
jgi:uncharacterized protein YjeT (DUF2065 family)